ncbi:hypothetical protein D3C81_1521070 [compost metagenome]
MLLEHYAPVRPFVQHFGQRQAAVGAVVFALELDLQVRYGDIQNHRVAAAAVVVDDRNTSGDEAAINVAIGPAHLRRTGCVQGQGKVHDLVRGALGDFQWGG